MYFIDLREQRFFVLITWHNHHRFICFENCSIQRWIKLPGAFNDLFDSCVFIIEIGGIFIIKNIILFQLFRAEGASYKTNRYL